MKLRPKAKEAALNGLAAACAGGTVEFLAYGNPNPIATGQLGTPAFTVTGDTIKLNQRLESQDGATRTDMLASVLVKNKKGEPMVDIDVPSVKVYENSIVQLEGITVSFNFNDRAS